MGARALGLVWLFTAAAFLVSAYAIWSDRGWALPLTAAVAVLSLVVCVLGSPSAVAGIAINLVILAALGYLTVAPSTAR